jgi:hypothetical protein
MCEFFKDKSTSYFKTNKKFWAFYKSVIKTKNSSNNQTIGNILDIKTNQSVSSAEDISRVFNEHFTNIKCEAVVSDDSCIDYVNSSFLEYKRNGTLAVEPFSFKQISPEAVKKLRNSTNLSFKDFSEYILSNLHSLFLKFSPYILNEM